VQLICGDSKNLSKKNPKSALKITILNLGYLFINFLESCNEYLGI